MNKPNSRLLPNNVFTVPKNVLLLAPEQIGALAQAFTAWRDAAVRADHLRSRERLRLVFQLLRHTGARLGEVLGLDDRTDMDLDRGMILIGKGSNRREVPIPQRLARELRRVLESPLAAGYSGDFLHADQGLVRRTFYARADECGVPRELATARVLRNTRAVEMLRSGVPLAVVQTVLGRSPAELKGMLQQYSGQDAAFIVRRLALGDMSGRTSARNSFYCRVTGIARDAVMAEVRMESKQGDALCAVITTESLHSLGLEQGVPVVATVKAPLISVQKPFSEKHSSRRNTLVACVTKVRASKAITEISALTTQGQDLCALVSASTAHEFELAPGDQAVFTFKALSVVLNTL